MTAGERPAPAGAAQPAPAGAAQPAPDGAGALAAIYRHPVKSLGVEALDRVRLAPGAWMPMDRVWALAHADSAFDPARGDWVAPNGFARVTHAPRLAQVRASWHGDDTGTGTLTLTHPDAPSLTVAPQTEPGRAAIAAWAEPLARGARPGPYRLVRARQPLSDVPRPWLSVLALASLRALSQRVGRPLDPLRFRANLWLEGFAPWQEADWPGRTLAIGPARLKVIEPIWRCAATCANPETGHRDADALAALRAAVGDTCFGVYAEVVAGGAVALGDPARLV